VNAEDRWGNRPLDDAKRCGVAKNAKCIQLLERLGAICGKMSASANTTAAAASALGVEALHDLMFKYGKIRDGELSMSWHDVKDLLVVIGEEPTDDVVRKLFEVADVDKDGLISSQQFLANSEIFLGKRPARIILVVGGPGSGKVFTTPYH
jgi:hypothetical protein